MGRERAEELEVDFKLNYFSLKRILIEQHKAAADLSKNAGSEEDPRAKVISVGCLCTYGIPEKSQKIYCQSLNNGA